VPRIAQAGRARLSDDLERAGPRRLGEAVSKVAGAFGAAARTDCGLMP